MVDTYTTGKLGLIEPSRGAYVGTWDEPLYANWQTLDAALSGTTTITLSSSNVILTVPTFPSSTNPPSVATSAQNLRLYMTGAMSSNLTVYLPATVGGIWIADNNTSGGYTVTIKTTSPGSTGVNLTTGNSRIIYSNGVNVSYADNSVPPGTILSSARTTAPDGYLLCTGSAVSRTVYSGLFSAIGTTWGSGDGSTTFNVPDLSNMFLRGSGTSAVGVYEADLFAAHNHSISDPGHSHLFNYAVNTTPGGSFNFNQVTGGSTTGTTTSTTGISINNTGGAETRPKNKRVLYIIKT